MMAKEPGLIVGHTVNDLDCFGSLVLARHLYPGYVAARSNRLSPVVKNIHTLLRDEVELLSPAELAGRTFEHLVVVDTRSARKIEEYLEVLGAAPSRISVWDHHCTEECTIEGAELASHHAGANTSILALELRDAGGSISAHEATAALAAIHADTGSFSHDNVSALDFAASEWLIGQGASMQLVRKFLSRLQADSQHSLFHDLLGRLEKHTIQGHQITIGNIRLSAQTPGISGVVDQIAEIESCDALFVLVEIDKDNSHLIVARSMTDRIDVNSILGPLGGGGHPQAASVLIKGSKGFPIKRHLLTQLTHGLQAPISARELMTSVTPIIETWSLIQASMGLEAQNLTGAPVLDENGKLAGMLTLREIQKARKSGKMQSPVKAFMIRNPLAIQLDAGLREIERIFFTNDIGHLPVLHQEGLAGMITRGGYLRHFHPEAAASAVTALADPAPARTSV